MSDLVDRLRDLSYNGLDSLHSFTEACEDAADELDRLNAQALELCAEISGLRRRVSEAERLLQLAEDYVEANQGGWCRDGVGSGIVLKQIRAALAGTADQPTVARSLLREATLAQEPKFDPTKMNLVVTRNGVPVADQRQGVEAFKAACLQAACPTKQPTGDKRQIQRGGYPDPKDPSVKIGPLDYDISADIPPDPTTACKCERPNIKQLLLITRVK